MKINTASETNGYSMYETLRNLPLLNGASHELISGFIEKTHFDFKIYSPGEEIVKFGDDCSALTCLLSGRMEVVHPMYCGYIRVREEVAGNCIMGLERLFGLDNRVRFSAVAIDRCGTVKIPKNGYTDLLRSDNIYLVNCMNYLSRAVQRYEDIMCGARVGSFTSLLANLVEMSTMRNSENISIMSVSVPIMDFLPKIMDVEDTELDYLVSNNLIKIASRHKIEILDREGLISAAEKQGLQQCIL